MKRRAFIAAIAGAAVAPKLPAFTFPSKPIFPSRVALFDSGLDRVLFPSGVALFDTCGHQLLSHRAAAEWTANSKYTRNSKTGKQARRELLAYKLDPARLPA